MIDIFLVFTLLAWTLFILALAFRNFYLGFLSGLFITVMGIFAMIYGIGDTNDNLTRIFAFINIGIGLYIFLNSGIEILEEADVGSSNVKLEED